MRKLFKKSLACILTAIICVSLCVVAVPASAAAAPAYSTLAVEAKAGETVDVTFNVSNFADVKGAQIKFFLPEVVASIEAVKCNAGELVPYADGEGNYEIDAEAKSIKLIALFGYEDELAAVDKLVLTATVVIAEDAVPGTYGYAAPEITLATATGYVEVDTANSKFGDFKVVPAVVEPVLDKTLTVYQANASITDSLGMAYVMLTNTYSSKYAKVEMEVTAKKYNADRDLVTMDPVTVEFVALNAALETATYSGIAMYEIDQELTAIIKAYDADGNYVAYSNPIVGNPADSLKKLYASSTNATYKTMVTDMLNLGAAAQKYFGDVAASVNPDNDLLANYKANAINKGWDQTYASAEMPELNLSNKITWAPNSPLTSSDLLFSANLNLAGTPSVSYLMYDKNNKYEKEDLRLEISYTAVYPKLYAGLRTETINGVDMQNLSVYEMTTFSKMTLTDSNQVVTAKLYCKDQLVLTSEYTMDQGIKTQAATAGAKDLATALGKFEAAARAYFASV